ncbi:hypothetical protein ACSAGD_05990 [Paramicrobacterium sp. CJ85]|uniref:hypothetical protein n=1 Tax=Paramicrobacterium sp. CJ85 TaxID=3445355 RepID=UPI003F6419A0
MTNHQPPQNWNSGEQAYRPAPGAPVPPPQQHYAPYQQPASAPRNQQIAVGPFTLRELLIFIATLLILISSFLPLVSGSVSGGSLWSMIWPLAIPGALLPLASAVLLLIRRLSSGLKLRVGSLSVDQFASATSIVAASMYAGLTLIIMSASGSFGMLFSIGLGIGPVLGLLFGIVLVVLTTFGSMIPPFSADFSGRATAEAHVMARPITEIVKPQSTAYAAPYGGYPAQPSQPWAENQAPAHAEQPFQAQAAQPNPYARPETETPQAQPVSPAASEMPPAPQPETGAPVVDSTASAEQTASPDSSASDTSDEPVQSAAPFWVWSPRPRSVIDQESGQMIFEIGPGAWALAVEDRGSSLVLRNDDGRVGILNDIDGLTRG